MLPFFERLRSANRVLIAGCGGGFDIYAGVPLALSLLADSKQVVLANYSFTNLAISGAQRFTDVAWRIDASSSELPYFPEKWLCEWLQRRDQPLPVYAFAKTGVIPLSSAYAALIREHAVDIVVLIDGGTDSLLFGDEPGLGTVTEDAVSIVAAHGAAGESVLLAALGFGIDHYHGVSHHSFLENVARLTRDGGFLGAFSLTKGADEAEAFLDLVEYANARQPAHRSIVNNSVASAIRGEFGDYHATNRTSGEELFVNPLMAQYWTFSASHVVRAMSYASDLLQTRELADARGVIERVRDTLAVRPRRALPL
jgi:hypothetical protein